MATKLDRLDPEFAAEIHELLSLKSLMEPPMKLVWLDGKIVADADVIVSPCDKNWWHNNCKATNGEIKVRR